MNQLREALVKNPQKYHIDKVFDFKKEKKWDFLKLDMMNWSNFIDAQSMGLTNEEIRTIYEEHISSIEASIHGAAKIYSITLNQSYKRKKKISYLESQGKKYQGIKQFIDGLEKSYYEELEKIKQYSINVASTRYKLEYINDSTLYRIREDVFQLEQIQQLNIKETVKFFNYLLEVLKSLRERIEEAQEDLLKTIEKNKDCAEKETEIMESAASNMKQMRENYLYSFIYYLRLQKKDKKSTKKQSFEDASVATSQNESAFQEENSKEVVDNQSEESDNIFDENEDLATI